tara:strand:+ start:1269 stop:1742 length:474 start_codon:yes stop_codon:yes gene_type:complete
MITFFGNRWRDVLLPKTWLLIVAIPHTIFSALVPLSKSEIGSTYFVSATFALLNTVVLLSIYFFTEGRSQARMVAVTGGAVFLWLLVMIAVDPANGFDLSAELAPPFLYKFSINLELAPPLLLWGLLSLGGVLNWNDESEEDSETTSETSESEIVIN